MQLIGLGTTSNDRIYKHIIDAEATRIDLLLVVVTMSSV